MLTKWLYLERTKNENRTEINVRIADIWKHSRKFSRQKITESAEDPLTKKFSAESFPGLNRGKRFFTLRLPEARPVSLKFHGRARSWNRASSSWEEIPPAILLKIDDPWRTPIAQNFHLKQCRRIFRPYGPPLYYCYKSFNPMKKQYIAQSHECLCMTQKETIIQDKTKNCFLYKEWNIWTKMSEQSAYIKHTLRYNNTYY